MYWILENGIFIRFKIILSRWTWNLLPYGLLFSKQLSGFHSNLTKTEFLEENTAISVVCARILTFDDFYFRNLINSSFLLLHFFQFRTCTFFRIDVKFEIFWNASIEPHDYWIVFFSFERQSLLIASIQFSTTSSISFLRICVHRKDDTFFRLLRPKNMFWSIKYSLFLAQSFGQETVVMMKEIDKSRDEKIKKSRRKHPFDSGFDELLRNPRVFWIT